MKKIPLKILDTINETINRYNMFSNKIAYVAFSGGKDSSFLCHALKELDYKVVGITTDIGYNVNWNTLKDIASKLEIETLLLDVSYLEQHSPEAREIVIQFFEDVKISTQIPVGNKTICTPCYNAKICMLKYWAESNGISQIAFAHHGTDSIASLLKSYFYYFDRMHCDHLEFNYSNFNELVASQAAILVDNSKTREWDLFIDFLKKLVQEKVVGTDETPRKHIENSTMEIIRPLFEIYESDIWKFFNDQNISFEKSECVVSKYRSTNILTPREMMHYYITDKLDVARLNSLHDVVASCLDQNGFLLYNVRNNRDKILGKYKYTENTKIKF